MIFVLKQHSCSKHDLCSCVLNGQIILAQNHAFWIEWNVYLFLFVLFIYIFGSILFDQVLLENTVYFCSSWKHTLEIYFCFVLFFSEGFRTGQFVTCLHLSGMTLCCLFMYLLTFMMGLCQCSNNRRILASGLGTGTPLFSLSYLLCSSFYPVFFTSAYSYVYVKRIKIIFHVLSKIRLLFINAHY